MLNNLFLRIADTILRWVAGFWAVPAGRSQGLLFGVYATLGVGLVLGAVYWNMYWLMGMPVLLALLWLAAFDFRKIFFFLMAAIPLSIEQALPGGFATDFPSEQLMWLLTVVGGLWFLKNWKQVDVRFVRHPVSLALFVHLAWLTVCVVTSEDPYVSFKFWLAKGWYVIVFYFLAGHILNSEEDYKKMLWWFFTPLLAAMLIVVTRHAMIGFSFQEVEYVMGPFFRNHVMYACSLAIFMPFVWYGTYWYKRYSFRWWVLVFGILAFLVGINFAYTRAAYVALVAAVGLYWMIRRRLMKLALIGFAVVLAVFIGFVGTADNWLRFAPDYERTITHTRFTNLLEATTKLEDISTMERVYRWVASTYMIREKPLCGFGPGTFYFYYKNYTVNSFKTYVSGNPEHSGIHNYYLLMAVEQGFPGMIFFIFFSIFTMLRGEKVYHQTKNVSRRRTLLAAVLCFILIDLLMLMNDLVETDKIGSLFFMCVAILVNVDLNNQDEKAAETV